MSELQILAACVVSFWCGSAACIDNIEGNLLAVLYLPAIVATLAVIVIVIVKGLGL